jgi:hypothetical protein
LVWEWARREVLQVVLVAPNQSQHGCLGGGCLKERSI